MYDMLLQIRPRLAERAAALLPQLGVAARDYVLVTVHRPANTDDPEAMRRIAGALDDLEMTVVFPIHPRTRKLTEQYGIAWSERVLLVEPLGHQDFLVLAQATHRKATDSGGVQKQAFLLGVPCITMRDETEWIETVECGWNVLVGNDRPAIVADHAAADAGTSHAQPLRGERRRRAHRALALRVARATRVTASLGARAMRAIADSPVPTPVRSRARSQQPVTR